MKATARAMERATERESFRIRTGAGGALLAALALAAAPAAGQMVGPRMATRAELQAKVDSLEAAAAALDDGPRLREVSNLIGGIRYRLEHGDIWPGDVLQVYVTGEAKWQGDFPVTPARTLALPDIDPIPLRGVLYSEAEEALSRALSRYLREPRVTVRVLKRIAIVGEVGNPGFYTVNGSLLVADAIMTAGGPSQNAKLEKVKIRRYGKTVELGRPKVAFQSLSLDQLGVRSGDELFVPRKGGGIGYRTFLGILGAAASITLIVTRVSR